jgi:hypothetical protein
MRLIVIKYTYLDFVRCSGKSNEEFLTWEDILQTLYIIRSELQSQSQSSIKYKSFKQYYDDTYKHKRKETAPNQIFKNPVTYGQIYGFHKFIERDLNYTRFPRKKCEETKYSESIVRTGKNFMK